MGKNEGALLDKIFTIDLNALNYEELTDLYFLVLDKIEDGVFRKKTDLSLLYRRLSEVAMYAKQQDRECNTFDYESIPKYSKKIDIIHYLNNGKRKETLGAIYS